jgi:hypothetical protein
MKMIQLTNFIAWSIYFAVLIKIYKSIALPIRLIKKLLVFMESKGSQNAIICT